MTRCVVIADVPEGQRSVAPVFVQVEGGDAEPRPVFFSDHPAAARYAVLKAAGARVEDRARAHLFPGFAGE